MKLGVIGAGNMAQAILMGILEKKLYKRDEIIVSRRDKEALSKIKEELGIEVSTDNKEIVTKSEIILLAVKPQMLSGVISEIKDYIREEQIIISIAAGKTIEWFENQFGKKIKLVRSMPNTPAMVGEGCTGYCCNENITQEERAIAERIFNSYGTSCLLKEELMDAFSAVAGSGPAFVFMFMEALADAAVLQGIPRDISYKIAAKMVSGSGKLMEKTGTHPAILKDMVCSPKGTTICGVKALEEGKMRAGIMEAVNRCVERAKQL